MAQKPRRILIVARTPATATDLMNWLADAGHEVVVVATFASAKAHLKTSPDALITEVKLGEYNGLHLALRAQADGIPAAVVGEPDAVLESDARQIGAAFVPSEQCTRATILRLIDTMTSGEASGRGAHTSSWVTARQEPSGPMEPELDWAIAAQVSVGNTAASRRYDIH